MSITIETICISYINISWLKFSVSRKVADNLAKYTSHQICFSLTNLPQFDFILLLNVIYLTFNLPIGCICLLTSLLDIDIQLQVSLIKLGLIKQQRPRIGYSLLLSHSFKLELYDSLFFTFHVSVRLWPPSYFIYLFCYTD